MAFSLWDVSSTYTQSHLLEDLRVVLIEMTLQVKIATALSSL